MTSSNHNQLFDQFCRPLRDLRISVTDRCNFRCVYCMPKTVFGRDYPFLPRGDLLSFEEIERIARIFVELGIKKLRLTGGEPLLRHRIENLVELLAAIPDVDIALTTNAALLAPKAAMLRDAGLKRVTVSLDALDDAVFRRMNDTEFPVAQVLAGIAAADAAGLAPLKVNCVVKRGCNETEILPLVRYFRGSGHILRFIEYMDVGSSNGWRLDEVVPAAEIVQRIAAEFPLEPLDASHPGEVAQRWRYRDGQGEIGVVSSVTRAFCDTCNRIRLATDGRLYTCLFATNGHDLRSRLRDGESDDELSRFVRDLWQQRDDRYSQLRLAAAAQASDEPVSQKIEMSYIGG